MLLSEKIAFLRREAGLSQEELAERLEVSRQAVSKWESGASAPDLSRIASLSDFFGVSADALIRDEIDLSAVPDDEPVYAEESLVVPEQKSSRRDGLHVLTLDEAYAYASQYQSFARRIALGVAACVFSPGPLCFLAYLFWGFGEGLGVALLLALVAWAVYQFIMAGGSMAKYSFIARRRFVAGPGVAEWAQSAQNRYQPAFLHNIAIGVVLCIVSVAPLCFFSMWWGFEGFGLLLMFALIAAAVYLFICSGMQRGIYHRLLRGR